MISGMLLKVTNSWISYIPDHTHKLYIGFRKKLEALAKKKGCELVAKWQRSIINHLYWCVASTPDCNGEVIKAKWLSLERHIHNKHTGHGRLFPKCTHGKLVGQNRNKKWFKPCKLNVFIISYLYTDSNCRY